MEKITHLTPELFSRLESKNKELLSLLNLNGRGNVKNWAEIFNKFNNPEVLEEFYEKQKKTFGSKEKSSFASLYFYNFILSFLKFYPKLNNRQKEICGILLRHLEKCNNELYNDLISLLPFSIKKELIKEKVEAIDREKFFESIDSIDELLNIFNKHRLAFHHKGNYPEVIIQYYVPFIKTFDRLYNEDLLKKYKEKIYHALLLLEHNAKKIDKTFNLKDFINKISFKEIALYSVLSRLPNKKWKEFFDSFENLDDLNLFYRKKLTSFGRIVKQNDINFFKYFILSYNKFLPQDANKIASKMLLLISYLKKIDNQVDTFLLKNNISYKTIEELTRIKKSRKVDRYGKKTKGEKSKNIILDNKLTKSRVKTKDLKDNCFKKNTISIKSRDNMDKSSDYIKELNIIFSNLSRKGVDAEGVSWYKKGLEKYLEIISLGYNLSKQDTLRLINLLKINDVYFLYKAKKLYSDFDIDKTIFYLTVSNSKNIFMLDDKYIPIFKKIYKELSKKVPDTEKQHITELFNKIVSRK